MLRCFVALVSAALVSCVSTVRSGSYGPFQIGDEKVVIFAQLEALGVVGEPVPAQPIRIPSPSVLGLHDLNKSDGVLVWVEHVPLPLRVEFENSVVARKWGGEIGISRSPGVPLANDTLALVQFGDQIAVGDSRDQVYQRIVDFGRTHYMEAGNFVVGVRELQERRRTGMSSQSAYCELLLRNDAWRFEGLRDLAATNPYYSTITLHFVDGRLSWIEHMTFPFELP